MARYRILASDDAEFLPDLAAALTNLGVLYIGLGRPQDAIVQTEEAVGSYRALISANPTVLPNLSMALINLGHLYHGVGRVGEAAAVLIEATTLGDATR